MGRKGTEKAKKIPFRLILEILAMLCALYAYQYYMRPEINIQGIEAQYSTITKKEVTRIKFLFKIKNFGLSKTKNSKLFSAFPQWTINQSHVSVIPNDFVYSDISDLISGENVDFITYKDINTENFFQNIDMAQGIYLVVVLRWQGDNLAFFGRTFEKHLLFFLKPGIKDSKMIFLVQQIDQMNSSRWFANQADRPDILEMVQGIGAARLLYGDTSRFD